MTSLRKKVLVISTTPTDPSKGSFIRVKSIIEYLSKDFDIDFVTYSIGEDYEQEGVNIIRTPSFYKPDLRISIVSPSRLLLSFLVFLQAVRMMLKNGNKYDLVHCEDFEAATMGALYSFIWRKPKYVYDLHNSIVDNLEITGVPQYFLNFAKLVERFTLSRHDMVIANWKMYLGMDKFASKNIFLYHDRSDIRITKCSIPTDKPYLAYSGNYKAYQGIEEFLKAYAQADIDMHVVLVGNAKDSNKELVEELGISEKVFFTGRLPIDESNYILANSYICLLPRTYGVQPGLKAIHHIMLGKVTLASDIPANTEILIHDTNALLYDGIEELVSTLKDIESGNIDIDKLEAKVRGNQDEFNEMWSREYFMKNYLEVFDDEK